MNHYAVWIKGAAIAVPALALVLIGRALPLERAVPALAAWVEGLGAWGPPVFGLMYIGATLLFVPVLVLTLATGALFGVWQGTLTVSLASTAGAALAFLLARYLARVHIVQLMRGRPTFAALDHVMAAGGWKMVALLRLAGALPFSLENYLCGVTPIGFWPYLVTSWLAMLPGTVLYVYIGHVAGEVSGSPRARTAAEWAALGLGLAATVLVTLYITYLATKALQKQTAGRE